VEENKTDPFNVTFKAPEEAQPGDKVRNLELSKVLRAEMSGILNWSLEGCQLWQKEGLGDTPAVKHLKTDYQESQDIVGRFLKEETEPCDGGGVKASTLYNAFKKWCEDEEEKIPNGRDFSKRMEERGCKKVPTKYGRFYHDLKLVKVESQ